ncbi:hypothetical protein P3L10_020524 [Capsicum annuum]
MDLTSILVLIMIKYGGQWISEVEFENFIINRVLFGFDYTYDVFVVELYKQLNIEPTKGLLDIKYIVTAGLMPIYNSMSVRLYMEIKKKRLKINEYLLCITLVPVQFTAYELSTDIQIHHIPIVANHFSDIEDDFSEEHLDDEPNPIIMDPLHWDVEERQPYWNKNTITSVMKHYAIRHKFQFKVNRSSISSVTAKIYPNTAHCICIYHQWNNIKEKFKRNQKQLKGIFFAMARTYIKADFDRLMEDADKIDKRLRPYLFEIGYEKWSILHSSVNRSMVMTSNIEESLNSANREARELPVNKLLQFMMDLVMKWNNENRINTHTTFTELGNKYHIIMRENLILLDKMKVMASTSHVYGVIDETQKQSIVCMCEKRYSYLQFQVDGIPCAMAVLSYTNMNVQSYCTAYYSKKNYLKAYEFPAIPLPDETIWNIPTEVSDIIVLPPIWKSRPGRPRNNNRGKGIFMYYMSAQKVSCGRCRKVGHNQRT